MKHTVLVSAVLCLILPAVFGCTEHPREAKAKPSADSIKAIEISISAADIDLANSVIEANTMTIPGFGVGTSAKTGPGKFSAADALVVYLLKYHQASKVCPPVEVVSNLLLRLPDADFAKKAVSVFWLDYSTAKIDSTYLSKPSFLKDSFEWYINTKTTEKMKISNARMEGFVGAGEAWQAAMKSQRKSWTKSQTREDEYYLVRDQYRTLLHAQSAVAAAERAVSSGY